MTVKIQPLTQEDLGILWELSTHHTEWKKFDAPYFEDGDFSKNAFLETFRLAAEHERWKGIWIDGVLSGLVSYYFDDGRLKRWIEMGIVIYDERLWSRGYGREALKLWTTELFERFDLPRLGLTTWSGNPRMVRAARKVGFQLEGQIRKVRFWQGEYYDSVRLGVLREEWFSRD
ncbi:GNAT family N-acetyltransferase [Deinococcus cellulosilyticus]|uniref:N-acetyltransferase n=1 Tax=Deinococcus cellulosilyticus (strain DSM 18568 / NBRC 106333 / KACC 11606 / 5516J-15) TaxID=1223518 RepID=A0A511N0Z6_DEIC1|nr:GNAT family protein [Deinococcus cellulosilyticus]GEM46542.1 N-acetyltransferase [Deinococcus cellulosilyticus NBRC 106333 = KACC 11606]